MADGNSTAAKPGRAGRAKAPTTADPIEIAMEAEAEGEAPTGVAAALLADQRRLIGWQVASERAGFALKVLTAVAGLAFAGALAGMAWQASRSASLVIDAFTVPPDLAQRGLTGQVVASRILDRMTEIQGGIDSQRAPSSFARAWDGGIEVQIPQTGVTLDQLKRSLRAALGHDTHVSGEVVRTPSGVALTVRAGAKPGVTFPGADKDLDSLFRQAGESAFEQTEPYRYGVYLRAHDPAKGEAVFRRLAETGSPGERAWAYIGMGNSAKDLHGSAASLAVYRAAEALAPHQSLPPQNISMAEFEIGHPEAARAAAVRARRTVNPRGEVRPERIEALRQRIEGLINLVDGDYAESLRNWNKAGTYGPQGMNQSLTARMAAAHIGLHELTAARADLDRPDPTEAFTTGTRQLDSVIGKVRVFVEREAWSDAIAEAAKAEAIVQARPGVVDQKHTQLDPQVAYAMARSGDVAGAEALIGATPLDSYDAVIMRGRIAALAGDPQAADRWFARAQAMAPSVGMAPAAWAAALLARGDTDGAVAKARIANDLAPRFADPLAVWGEALLARGDARAAASRFREAAERAPRWGRVHLMWGEALAKLGRSEEARAKWRAAATMDLTPSERTRLQTRLHSPLGSVAAAP